ncbi:MAG: methyltransferase [Bacteroidetes bacterium]|nr:MAG: methyltransferase [Bacteroidota bacterium]
MTEIVFNEEYKKRHLERINRTLKFVDNVILSTDKVLDLGPVNSLSKLLISQGFNITNTPKGIDLDLSFDIVKEDFDVVTAFEIFEHMVSPFPLLRAISAKKLVASVPLKLWFTNAYWNNNDPFDKHYHEFEPKQFDLLLNKAGWRIIKSEKWVSKTSQIGVRPLLRRFVPRYYIVYCERE